MESTVPSFVKSHAHDVGVPVDASVTPIPVPVIDEGRNVSYAIQWLLFAAVAIGGWLFFLRREAREDATRAPSERQEEASPWTST